MAVEQCTAIESINADRSEQAGAKKSGESCKKWLELSAEIHKVMNYKHGEYSTSFTSTAKQRYISELSTLINFNQRITWV